LLLSGARQVGKTTLFLQTVDDLINKGVPPANILYATFDHPLLKLVGLDIVRLWREFEPAQEGPEYLFLDEIQITKIGRPGSSIKSISKNIAGLP